MRAVAAVSVVAALGLGLGLGACFSNPFYYGPRSGGGVPGEVSYADDVYPILMAHCSACHSEGGPGANSEYVLTGDPAADYATIAALVTPGDPAGSELLVRARGGDGHPGGQVLAESSVEYQTLAKWVEQGAAQQ